MNDTAHDKKVPPSQIGNAIAHSTNVQNALDVLMTAIRHEARQNGVSVNATLEAVDDPLDAMKAEIEWVILDRFKVALEKKVTA